MTDLARFEEDFRSWVDQAGLPLLKAAVEIISAQALQRGRVAVDYLTPSYVAFFLLADQDVNRGPRQ